MITLAALAVFSGLSLNLFLSFAVGAGGAARDSLSKSQTRRQLPVFQFAVLFVSIIFLWIIFTYLLPSSWTGFLVYFLFFPLSALVCMGLEFARERLFPKFGSTVKVYSAFTGYDGLAPASLIITCALAANFASALVLALFFVLGSMAAMLTLNEIRRRSTLEWVPVQLRGSPLVFISMGLLSLIAVSAAGICFRILEVFP